MHIGKILLTGVLLVLFNTTSYAAVELLDEYLWRNRVLLIFTPDQSERNFLMQKSRLESSIDEVHERDLIIMELPADKNVSINGRSRPVPARIFFDHFRIPPDLFTVMLIGKDGSIKLSRTSPVTNRELFELIDAMPMRQQEMRERADR